MPNKRFADIIEKRKNTAQQYMLGTCVFENCFSWVSGNPTSLDMIPNTERILRQT